jgi:ribosomal protein S18 acetylase RimI-like enzyme
VIRLGTPADHPAAAAVYRAASLSNPGDRDALLANPASLEFGQEGLADGRTWIADQDGAVVGFATWAVVDGVTELEDLFVDPACRRQGHARALVARIGDVLRERGVARLEVTANPHAMKFYRAAGFVDAGAASTEFGPAPRMVLRL